MANNEFTRFSRKVVQYFWDPMPKNEDEADIWCLGRSYESRYHSSTNQQQQQQSHLPGTSPSTKSDSSVSQADSAIETAAKSSSSNRPGAEEGYEEVSRPEELGKNNSQADLTKAEEEALGWPPEFLDDLESRIWMTYRNNFPPIPKSSDPSASANMSFSTRLRNLGNQTGFTSDTGYGCMIRSGQSLLANALSILRLGRDWRLGSEEAAHVELLSLFADTPEAPFSIHRFVEHGAQACGKHPGEWFGPSATARCIQSLTNKHHPTNLRVYARPDDGDIYLPTLLSTATQLSPDPSTSTSTSTPAFQPTLIVLGVRLGIERITPVYHHALATLLQQPQCVGIAGGRPSSSHYFVGHQGGKSFFYLDPHATRPALPAQPGVGDVASCHTRRVRRLGVEEMDPSMLIGFLVRSREELEGLRGVLEGGGSGSGSRSGKEGDGGGGKAIVHFHDTEPPGGFGAERAGAVDEVETLDETGDDDDDEDDDDEEEDGGRDQGK